MCRLLNLFEAVKGIFLTHGYELLVKQDVFGLCFQREFSRSPYTNLSFVSALKQQSLIVCFVSQIVDCCGDD